MWWQEYKKYQEYMNSLIAVDDIEFNGYKDILLKKEFKELEIAKFKTEIMLIDMDFYFKRISLFGSVIAYISLIASPFLALMVNNMGIDNVLDVCFYFFMVFIAAVTLWYTKSMNSNREKYLYVHKYKYLIDSVLKEKNNKSL